VRETVTIARIDVIKTDEKAFCPRDFALNMQIKAKTNRKAENRVRRSILPLAGKKKAMIAEAIAISVAVAIGRARKICILFTPFLCEKGCRNGPAAFLT
jgi:hypothetical protein